MTNRPDLFDDPESQPGRTPEESPPSADAKVAASSSEGNAREFSRRQVLRGGAAAAAAGAVVGAGAAVGLGATRGGEGGASTAAREAGNVTLGAPAGRMVSQALVRLNVNGKENWVQVSPNETLAEVLRQKLGLTGTNIGCDRSECSACSVIVDGTAMNSCSLLAIREDGKKITTIEGLSKDGKPSDVQQAFIDAMGLQCGFCTPGQVMQATALLQKNKKPTEADIRRALSGNLCKCAAYPNIMTAVMKASEKAAAS